MAFKNIEVGDVIGKEEIHILLTTQTITDTEGTVIIQFDTGYKIGIAGGEQQDAIGTFKYEKDLMGNDAISCKYPNKNGVYNTEYYPLTEESIITLPSGATVTSINDTSFCYNLIKKYFGTYAFGKNKCKHEVYNKEEFDSKFAVVTIGKGKSTVSYPEGFTKDNTVILSVMRKEIDGTYEGYWTDGKYTTSETLSMGWITPIAYYALKDTSIQVAASNSNCEHRIVLMKIS